MWPVIAGPKLTDPGSVLECAGRLLGRGGWCFTAKTTTGQTWCRVHF